MDDVEAFCAVYEREHEVVMGFVVRRTLNVAVAADLTAETFALALRSWPRLRSRSEEEVRAWLFTVASRQVSRFMRRGHAELRAVKRLGIRVPMLHEDDIAAIEERAGLAGIASIVKEQLRLLSDEQRAAVRLRVVEERSYTDVARLLGISEQAARARVSRGLRRLAAAIESGPQASEVSR